MATAGALVVNMGNTSRFVQETAMPSSNVTTPPSIIVTGCSSGIGAHCARALKAEGWRVFATVRRQEDVAGLEADGIEVLLMDYTKPDTIAALVETVLARTGGRLDALFNNGAYGQAGAVEDLPVEVLRLQFETNVFGWHDLTRQVIPVMRRQGFGRIVQCSSILGIVPYRWRGAYNASKFALEALSLTLRMELAGSGVHVSLIEPGPITSRFTANALTHIEKNIDLENSVHAEEYRRQAGGGACGAASCADGESAATALCRDDAGQAGGAPEKTAAGGALLPDHGQARLTRRGVAGLLPQKACTLREMPYLNRADENQIGS
jgi:NAD(P)-dependent dehydrogenase (short-subunit alcohol dehydrogenase family)